MRTLKLLIIAIILCGSISVFANDGISETVPAARSSQWPAAMVSGALPVIYINTIDNKPIESKTDYIDATYWIDPKRSNFKAVGSKNDQQKTEIRGRGNWTWQIPGKKPYKLKLDKKTSLLDMPKSKHWALLADAKSYTVITSYLASEISKALRLAWTPSFQPVEVVLNDEYIGFYTLAETVRVEETRVNIHEQADEATDPSEVEGAWLLEIDNQNDEYQVRFWEPNGTWFRLTPDTPEKLSEEQMSYLENQMDYLTKLIYSEDKEDSSELESVLDFKALAKFYLVNELIDDLESFSGSCFFYKDAGKGQKWTFGPIWDMGNAFVRTKGYSRLFEDVNFENHWIQELLKYPKLRTEIMKLWAEFSRSYKVENFTDKIDRYANYIKPAWNEPEKERWPDYNIDFSWFPAYLKREFTAHFNLIDAWYRTLPEFYVYAPSSNQNTSGGAGGWKILGSFIGQPNCDYVAVVENLPTTFKIASADGVSFVLGPADAAKSIKQGEECALEEKANVFKSLNSYDKAVITYNPAKKTLVVDDASFAKVENIVNDAKDFTVNGTTVSALDHVCIYDLAGVTVATLSPGSSIVLAAGVYLVKGSSTISKIMVR